MSWVNVYDRANDIGNANLTDDQFRRIKTCIDLDRSKLGDRNLSYASELFQDAIYEEVFAPREINRFRREEGHILDMQYHIDCEVTLRNGAILLGQEKGLRAQFRKFNTFTIEFYQNRHTGERGEFFNLGAQYYLHGYWNDDYSGFSKWYLIKIFDFLAALKRTSLQNLQRQTRPSSGNASFFWIEYPRIPNEFIYAKHDPPGMQRNAPLFVSQPLSA